MSRHLTSEQFSTVLTGAKALDAAEHLRECPACEAELARLQTGLTQVHGSAADGSELPMRVPASHPRFAPRTVRAFAAACVLIFALAGLRFTVGMRRDNGADALLLNRVNNDVSRSVPGRLELLLVPEIR